MGIGTGWGGEGFGGGSGPAPVQPPPLGVGTPSLFEFVMAATVGAELVAQADDFGARTVELAGRYTVSSDWRAPMLLATLRQVDALWFRGLGGYELAIQIRETDLGPWQVVRAMGLGIVRGARIGQIALSGRGEVEILALGGLSPPA